MIGGRAGGVSRKSPYLVNCFLCRTHLCLGGPAEVLQLKLLGEPRCRPVLDMGLTERSVDTLSPDPIITNSGASGSMAALVDR